MMMVVVFFLRPTSAPSVKGLDASTHSDGYCPENDGFGPNDVNRKVIVENQFGDLRSPKKVAKLRDRRVSARERVVNRKEHSALKAQPA